MSETVITNVTEFHEQLGQLKPKDAAFLYRGQANATWPVDCSAARRLAADPANPIETQLIRHLLVGYLDILISTTRMRGFLPPSFSESISDLELLAHLQHQGAATGLIDFTRQPLVALWFACPESLNTDGAIYVLDRSQTAEINRREDLRDKTIQSIYAEDTLWSWEPSALGNRIVAQSSVFVFGVPEIARTDMTALKVRAESKSDILTQLETMYGINEEELFADFPGYAVANASTKNFDVKRSIRYWQEQIELASEDKREKETAHHNCGVAYHAIKDVKNAIEQYSEAIDRNPDFVEAYNNRGLANISLGRHENAFIDFDQAIRLKPDFADAYNNRGNTKSYYLGQYQDAIADYNEALRLKPDDADAYNNRGVAKNSLGRHEDAFTDFDQAIRLNPDYVKAYNNRGLAKNSLGQYQDAITDFDQAIKLKPDYVEAYLNRGNIKMSLGQHQDSIADYDEAIRLNPDYAEAYNNRGNAKNSLGQHIDAIADHDQAIRLNPNLVEAYLNRGNAKTVLGKRDKAITDYDQAIRLNPNLAEAYNSRGVAKNSLGQYEESFADYDQAIRLKPDYVEAYYNRGLAYRALNGRDKARRDFKKARALAQQAGNKSLAALMDQMLRKLNASDEGE